MMPESARKIFQKNLKRIAKERGFSQADIASALRLTPSTVSGWFLGNRYPRIDAMQRLADLLEVPIRYLTIENDEDPALTADEIRLLTIYRDLTKEGRAKVQDFILMAAALYSIEKNEEE